MRRSVVVTALGTSQTLAWASSYYIPAILATPIAATVGISISTFFAIFSVSLLLSAFLGPSIGRLIDRSGGRGVLLCSNLVFALGLGLLGASQSLAMLILAWSVLGVGMGMGLYDSAFAALAAAYGRDARGPITGVTLFAGFASTIGWPTSAILAELVGWQGACFFWAAMHLALGLPLNLLLPKGARSHEPVSPGATPEAPGAVPAYTMALLAFVFAATWFVTAAMAAHLPLLLRDAGATSEAAIAAAALVGPAQVAARLVEFSLLRRVHPLISARLATLTHPIGALTLATLGGWAAPAFALLHGAGNGMLTIAKGTLPLALFGPVGYGHRAGVLSVPARGTQAAAPFLFGLVLEAGGAELGLAISTGLTLAALAALLFLRVRPPG